MQCAVVLGGYGNFGRRVVASLAADRSCRVVVAGRDLQKASAVADEIGSPAEAALLDGRAANLAAELRRLGANVVVHTAGPFQGQDYSVARACIEARAHYVDLADARAYVCGIGALDQSARSNDVLVTSGASSVPALSSAVVDMLRTEFSVIESIDHGITSGAKPPGLATMEGVLGYAGKPIKQWRDSAWRTVYGWQDLTRRTYPRSVGTRWIANCDVPDLELFPQRYSPVRTVVFHAGVGMTSGMLSTWAASWLVRAGLLSSLVPLVPRLHKTALAVERFGSKSSAMHVTVRGLDAQSRSISRTWWLVADNDRGPEIPCFPAIALARKLLRGEVSARGAMPCMGLLTVDEILAVSPAAARAAVACSDRESAATHPFPSGT
ncbi:MAG TPA: saccharopine dehydrogenase NADP-binding domain-containing protein [Steroidobacteraceae bacterium]|jgi:saccharopine dehydrogenase-like NADP-dependent oxidoreductase|nr:saccharopine dehydrogenase NADP-binding domain-containing protein [Steroidobacteraceae bacterium]